MLYLDSSAIVKLVVPEDGSAQLRTRIHADASFASSTIARTEVIRAVRLHGTEAEASARVLLGGVEFIEATTAVLESASVLEPPPLRALDAIHIASALILGSECEAVVTYDRRMQEAARAAGLTVLAPGQD